MEDTVGNWGLGENDSELRKTQDSLSIESTLSGASENMKQGKLGALRTSSAQQGWALQHAFARKTSIPKQILKADHSLQKVCNTLAPV